MELVAFTQLNEKYAAGENGTTWSVIKRNDNSILNLMHIKWQFFGCLSLQAGAFEHVLNIDFTSTD